MTIDEHETTVCYDHGASEVRVYTTKAGVASQIKKRAGNQATVVEGKSGDRVVSWQITLPMSSCRSAFMVVKPFQEEPCQPDQ